MSLFGPPSYPLDNMLGAAFIGIIVSTAIYGVTCLQMYLYYTQHCNKDGLFLKLYVVALMLLETFHVALLSTAFYWYTVTNFGDLEVLANNTWSLLVEVVIGDTVTGMVQLFFAYQIYRMSAKRVHAPIVICLLAVAQLALAIVYVVKMFKISLFANAHQAVRWSASSLSVDLVNDIIIAVYMVYFLQGQRAARTSLFTTVKNKTVNLLIAYALNTCILAGVFTLVTLITNVTMPETMVYALFYFITVRLYACAMVSTLNSRGADQQVGANKDFISFTRTTVVTQDGVHSRPAVEAKWPEPDSASGTLGVEIDNKPAVSVCV